MSKVTVDGTRQHTVPRVAWRIISGHHLDGQPRTDATAFRRGTKTINPTGRTIRWSYLSRAERAAWRLGTVAILGGGTYGYVVAPTDLFAGLGLAGAGATGYTTHRTRRAVMRRKHYREWVRPLHRALAASALTPVNLPDDPDSYITVPIDYATNDQAKIVMRFGESFTGDATMRREIERIICDKLGLSDVVVSWRVAGREPQVTIQTAPRPPRKLGWSEARELMEAAPEFAPIIGLGPRGVPVSIDLDSESPHVLISAGSGGGKSVITRTMVAQLMRHGAHVVVLDRKRHSQRWLRGLPGVTYCRTAEEMHLALIAAAEEGERRNIMVEEDGDDATKGLPRIVVVAEEMNATISQLQMFWDTVRESSDPKRSPAIAGLGDILFMGRAVRINVVAIAQMMTARTLGGPEARENFAVRILARYTKNAWNMLVPEIQPVPRSSRHPGRAQVCIAGSATETQIIFGKDDECRDWATSGCACHGRRDGSWAGVPMSQRPSPIPTQGQRGSSVSDTVPLTLVPDLPPAVPELAGVTLAEAVRDGVIGLSLDAVRKASGRDPEFPEPVGTRGTAKLYDPSELMRWQRNRPRAVS
jgi:NAD(P)-dependent dehydrogenase (short-subunit alcohol dehydrogenase family)